MSENIPKLYEALRNRDRRSLARAITLTESELDQDILFSDQLLNLAMPHSGSSVRIGISGVPGVGKSSFIEAFGLKMIASGKKVAVLAVDPSSPLTGGSILGDKTRMEKLAVHENAFIRPSPAGSSAGGVGRKTRESILLCEAAGYDVVLVETVGVGQAEYTVASMVDVFLVLELPGGGDELQGIKKGILELADIVIVNKADGDLEKIARQSKIQLEAALHFSKARNDWQTPVMLASAATNTGLDDVGAEISRFLDLQKKNKNFEQKRQQQLHSWLEQCLLDEMQRRVRARLKTDPTLQDLERQVMAGKIAPNSVARTLLDK